MPNWRTIAFWLLSPLWMAALVLAFFSGGLMGILNDLYRGHSKP